MQNSPHCAEQVAHQILRQEKGYPRKPTAFMSLIEKNDKIERKCVLFKNWAVLTSRDVFEPIFEPNIDTVR